MAPMAIVASSSMQLSRGLIRMVRELHLSPTAVPVRQRSLLQGMCRLFDAHHGSILVTAIDADTGSSEIMASLTVEAPFPALDGVTPTSSPNGGKTSTSP